MAKMSKPRKKSHIVFGVLFAAIIFVAGATVILSCVAKDQYWNNSHLQDAILDLSEYDGSIAENDAGLDEIESAIQGFGAQIVECDPELVREVLTKGGSCAGEYFNSRFEDKSGINYAEYYDRLIGLIQKGDNKDLGRIAYYTQYLSYEYCKAANRNAREILKTANETSVRLFEVKWLLGVYGKKPAE